MRLHLPSTRLAVLLSTAACFAVGLPALGADKTQKAQKQKDAERDVRIEEQAARIEALKTRLAASADTSSAQAAQLAALQQQIAALGEAIQKEKDARGTERESETAARALDTKKLREAIDATPPSVRVKHPEVKLGGYLQSDFTTRADQADEIDSSTGDPLNQTRFLVRRARLRVDVDAGAALGGLELDANTVRGPVARLIGAEASLRIPPASGQPSLLMGTVGLFKTPFGFEVLQSDRDRLFIERSTAERALIPGEYDLGIRLQGGWRFLNYSVAVLNGHPIGERGYPGRSPTAARDVSGRLGVDAAAGPVALHGGLSALVGTGFHKGTAATKDQLVWRDYDEDNIVQLNELLVIPGQPATPSQSFRHSALGLDLRGELSTALGRLGVFGELYLARNLDRAVQVGDPIGAGRDVREYGFYVAAVQDLGAHLAVGARYDVYQPDRDATDARGGALVPLDPAVRTLSVALSLRIPDAGRLVFQYDRNSNALGRNADGSPTTLGANAFTARAQVEF